MWLIYVDSFSLVPMSGGKNAASPLTTASGDGAVGPYGAAEHSAGSHQSDDYSIAVPTSVGQTSTDPTLLRQRSASDVTNEPWNEYDGGGQATYLPAIPNPTVIQPKRFKSPMSNGAAPSPRASVAVNADAVGVNNLQQSLLGDSPAGASGSDDGVLHSDHAEDIQGEEEEELDGALPSYQPPAVNHAHKLGMWMSTAICGNDITSSCLYVTGLCVADAGVWAPICLLMVGVTLYLFRAIYGEAVTALPLNGGAYNVLLSVFKQMDIACTLICCCRCAYFSCFVSLFSFYWA
jgi:hypothetical protein